jgi:hypothetical protein
MEQIMNWNKFKKWNNFQIGTNLKNGKNYELERISNLIFSNLNKFQNLNILKFECSENYNMKEEIKQKRNKK